VSTGHSALSEFGRDITCSGCFPNGSAVGDAGVLSLIPGSGRSPEEEMGNHSSILAWKIPWTEEPGGLQSMGSQRVGRN